MSAFTPKTLVLVLRTSGAMEAVTFPVCHPELRKKRQRTRTGLIGMLANTSSVQVINERVILVQLFVALFLFINMLLISIFFLKVAFRTTMRYILFAASLLSDCLYLILSDVLLIMAFYQYPIHVWLCLIVYVGLSVTTFFTPFTLTAMTLERYIAICMPLRHAELCTTRSAQHCLLIIQGCSSVPCIIFLCVFSESLQHKYLRQSKICDVETFSHYSWQSHVRSAVSQFCFLLMCIVILVSYVKIMDVARLASAENSKSTWRGLRTVVLHGFQLQLCLLQFWCPFIEAAILQINFWLFINVRYINYITFVLAPKCLSPLIYGLRDDNFFAAIKNTARSLCKKP